MLGFALNFKSQIVNLLVPIKILNTGFMMQLILQYVLHNFNQRFNILDNHFGKYNRRVQKEAASWLEYSQPKLTNKLIKFPVICFCCYNH